jgi:hypothetical protein
LSADPIDPARVVLDERWTSQEHLDAHIAGLGAAPQPASDPKPTAVSILVYDVSGERPLR